MRSHDDVAKGHDHHGGDVGTSADPEQFWEAHYRG